ncbi:PREDICTED: putative receptor-like protein kinase At3g46340 isoform X1 [Camelina sativa]|uniref:non-specific serine/threonine protein kinase n=1 Tax=Camelina sativa TaxID=90675 RepID=A0ABM0YMI9_CAMSA|nr:PREDICTED: putative receptor-like protein kinase At3g46340 isoform X1 [Camelina sativa]
MESSHRFLLMALIVASSFVHHVQAQTEFISLDCGLSPSEQSPYIEVETGLNFSSDSSFIQSGKIGRIDASLEWKYPKSQTTLRYFPDGLRNCYNLSVHKGRNYLIRATSNYGNYDGQNVSPRFDLYIGPNFWVTIDLEKHVNGDTWEEIIHIPKSNSLDVCLIKTGTSTPIMSALELRALPNDTYNTGSSSLKSILRSYLSESTKVTRFPDDIHDRIWVPHFESEWKQISTALNVDNSLNSYFVPKELLMTAAIPANASAPLSFSKDLEFPNDKLIIYFHFTEVQALQANQTREFSIVWNGEEIYPTMRPQYLGVTTVYTRVPSLCEVGKCLLQLKRNHNSTLPPLLNAIEVLTVMKLPQSETNADDVIAIKNIKNANRLSRISWQGDPCVPRQFLWEGLSCHDTNVTTPPRIISLNLSSSGLTGNIATGIQNLTHLQKLDLSNNNLTGLVPEFLADMKSLLLIDLRKNKLNGSIPKTLRDREKKGLQLFVDGDDKKGDGNKCLSNSCVPKKKFPVMMVALAISAVLIETKRRRFTYSEVVEMTKNFQIALGEGGFGVVYHGYLNDSDQVAVKVLSQSSSQGYKHFKAEVELLLRVHHINLVSLIGYCDERDHLALIYEYMPNGDLRDHLSGKKGDSVLKWTSRLQIGVDAALGLEYLHYGCRPSMVHRDVKCTNILLDDHFRAKIADFGLSKSFQVGDESEVSTVLAGTPGYLDPEYYRTCRLAEMSDVYSFGIVLLEMITNQHVIDQAREKPHITEWVAFVLSEGDITRIVDPNLHGEYNSRSVWRALELGMSCANPSSEKRPNMSQVVIDLKECITSENSMKSKNKDSDSHGSLELSSSFDTDVAPSAR